MSFVEHKLLQGQGAGKWLPFARTKVAALHASAKAMRVNALVQRWTVEGGMVKIAVRVIGDQRYIHIRRKQCPTFFSGLVDTVGIGATPGIFEIPNLSPPPATILVYRRFFTSPAQTEPPRAWRDESGLVVSGPQAPALPASMFTGEMRKVVQVLQGMNAEVVDKDTFAINYSPMVSPTHGVWKSANGQRWIIEISNTGVVAWVMDMCRTPIFNTKGEEVLSYTPILTPKPVGQALIDAKAAGTFRELLPAEGVLEFYTKSPFFLTCGWAFNSDGHSAANVCYDIPGPIRSYLYTINIQESPEVEGLTHPQSATMARTMEGFISALPENGHMKYPLGRSHLLYSFDTAMGGVVDVLCDAPVYCYYDDDQLRVFRFLYDPHSDRVDTSELVPCVGGCPGLLVGPHEGGAPFIASGNVTVGAMPRFSDGPQLPHVSSFNASYRAHSYSDTRVGISNLPSSIGCNVGELVAQFTYYVIVGRTTFSLSGAEVGANVFAVPVNDREAVYVGYRRDLRNVTRTSFGSLSQMIPDPAFNAATCQFSAFTRLAITDECCETFGIPTRVTLTDTYTPVSAQFRDTCDNGTHAVNWDNLPTAAEITYFEQTAGQVNVGQQGTPLCGCQTECMPASTYFRLSYTAPDVDPIGEVDVSVAYMASGGVARDVPVQPGDRLFGLDFFTFTDAPSHSLRSLRDAFDPKKYIISPDIGKLSGADSISTAADYPVAEAAHAMAFIGVP